MLVQFLDAERFARDQAKQFETLFIDGAFHGTSFKVEIAAAAFAGVSRETRFFSLPLSKLNLGRKQARQRQERDCCDRNRPGEMR
jgi:hypothetical protein